MNAVLLVGLLVLSATVGVEAIASSDPVPLQNPKVWVDGGIRNCENNFPCLSTITEAVGIVDAGGRVFVYAFAQPYVESVIIDRPLALVGEGRRAATIASPGSIAFRIVSGGVSIANLTLKDSGTGILVDSVTSTDISDLTFQDVSAGIVIQLADGVRVSDVDIRNADGTGVYHTQSTNVLLESLDIAASVRGVYANLGSNLTLSNSVIAGSVVAGVETNRITGLGIGPANSVTDGVNQGIVITDGQQVVIDGNTIANNTLQGLNVTGSVGVTVTNNLVVANGGAGLGPRAADSGGEPLQGGGGGIWFWETDPVLVTGNIVQGNAGTGIGVAGARSVDYTFANNLVADNQGSGVLIEGGAARIAISDTIERNTGPGISLASVSDVSILSSTLRQNGEYGIRGQQATNVAIQDAVVEANGFVGYSPGNPSPRQTGGGGIWFWETDPSYVFRSQVRGNAGPGITLIDTTDFDVLATVVEGNALEGIVLQGARSSIVTGNTVIDNEVGILVRNDPIIPSSTQIFSNRVQANRAEGIRISSGNGLTLSANDVFANRFAGLVIEPPTASLSIASNTIHGNGGGTLLEMRRGGIVVWSSSPLTIGPGNLVFGNQGNGILLFRHPAAPSLIPHQIVGNAIYGNAGNGIKLARVLFPFGAAPSVDGVVFTANRVFGNLGHGLFSDGARRLQIVGNVIQVNGNDGVRLVGSLTSRIDANLFLRNGAAGIFLSGGSANSLRSNAVTGNRGLGIGLSQTLNNIVEANTVTGSFVGIQVSADWNQVCRNQVSDNLLSGIVISGSRANTVCRNRVLRNGGIGLEVRGSFFNTILMNDFVQNGLHAFDDGQNRYYVACLGGNFWDDHFLPQDEIDNCDNSPGPDGRWWDEAYPVVGGGNFDAFPWIRPVA